MIEVKINGNPVTIWTSTPAIIRAFAELEAERDELEKQLEAARGMVHKWSTKEKYEDYIPANEWNKLVSILKEQ